MATPKTWYRGPYMISTEPHLIQPSAVNAAFASDEMPWAKELELPLLTKMLSNSRSYTLYKLPDSSAELAGMTLFSCLKSVNILPPIYLLVEF